MRERINNSNNRAYSLETNVIADNSRGHLMIIEKVADVKITPERLRIGVEACAISNKISNNRAYFYYYIAHNSRVASFGYRKKLPLSKSLRCPSVQGLKRVRERIKNSNNRAYALRTNFIADISTRASFGYRKKKCRCKNRSGTLPYRG